MAKKQNHRAAFLPPASLGLSPVAYLYESAFSAVKLAISEIHSEGDNASSVLMPASLICLDRWVHDTPQMRRISIEAIDNTVVELKEFVLKLLIEKNSIEYRIAFKDLINAKISEKEKKLCNAVHFLSKLHEYNFDTSKLKNIDGWNENLEFLSNGRYINDTKLTTRKKQQKIDELIGGMLKYVIGENIYADYSSHIIVRNLEKTFAVKHFTRSVDYNQSFVGSIYGSYFIYRRARGAITSHLSDIDTIVRDFMWIRPIVESPKDNSIRTTDDRYPLDVIGYYFSAIDEQVYSITSISLRKDILMIDAIAHLDYLDTKSLCLYAGVLRNGERSRLSYGSLIGTIGDTSRTGSWSTIVVRPNIKEEEESYVHAVFETFTDQLSNGLRHKRNGDYDIGIERLYNFMSRANLCGVFYTRFWNLRKDDVNSYWNEPDLNVRKDIFERILIRTARHDDNMEKYLDSIFTSGDITALQIRLKIKKAIYETYSIAGTMALTQSELVNRMEASEIFIDGYGEEIDIDTVDIIAETLADVREARLINYKEYIENFELWHVQRFARV